MVSGVVGTHAVSILEPLREGVFLGRTSSLVWVTSSERYLYCVISAKQLAAVVLVAVFTGVLAMVVSMMWINNE